jgi:glucose/arabinose dehydrogenase
VTSGPTRSIRSPALVALLLGLVACSGADDATTGPVTDSSAITGQTDRSVTTTAATATSVGGGSAPSTTPAGPTTSAPTPPVEQLAALRLGRQPFAAVDKATGMVVRPADDVVYASSQTGQVWRLADPANPVLALDISAETSPYEEGSERGLLGIAFSPVDGRLFVFYTDQQAQSHLVSYPMLPDGTADVSAVWPVVGVPSTGFGHKGGGMSFDGAILYVGLGDGGGTNGRDAQQYDSLLGSIIRIVPRTTEPSYDYPNDNPFLGDPAKRPELWAKGLREPWGFWRDPVTGIIWMADVGNHTMEEIDRMMPDQKGLNFGWPFIEGTQVNHDGAPPDAVPPLYAYLHSDVGPAAIGGRVYRGAAIPGLDGAYVFADIGGKTFAVGAGDQVTRLPLAVPGVVTGFGTGPDGELYVLTHAQGIQKIVPA